MRVHFEFFSPVLVAYPIVSYSAASRIQRMTIYVFFETVEINVTHKSSSYDPIYNA
jgi:hypothetical protein